MKTTTISYMVIGMMIFGTTTGFGKTNNQPRNNNQPRKEVRVNDNHKDGPRPMMEKPIPKQHHHDFDRNHKCRVCHFSEHQLHMMDKHLPVPMDHNRH